MIQIILDSSEYTEAIQFPETMMGEESIITFQVKNPYGTRLAILEFGSTDKDLHILECPQYLDADDVGIVKVKYAPKRTRTESLNVQSLIWKIAI